MTGQERIRARLRAINARRDDRGRFVKAPPWWRPRDRKGRFRGRYTEMFGDLVLRCDGNLRRWTRAYAALAQSAEYTTTAVTNFTAANNNTFTGTGTYGNVTSGYRPTYSAYVSYDETAISFNDSRYQIQEGPLNLTTSDYVPQPREFVVRAAVTGSALLNSDQALEDAEARARRQLEEMIESEGLVADTGTWRIWVDEARNGFASDTATVNVTWREGRETPNENRWIDWASRRLNHGVPVRARETAEERAAREERERVAREERERLRAEREKQAAEAKARAEQLMAEVLSEAQVQEWHEHRHFHVETADGRRRYRIREGRAGNIVLVKDGDREAEEGAFLQRYCCHEYHPDGERLPVEDTVLAQALFIQTAEDEFLELANAG